MYESIVEQEAPKPPKVLQKTISETKLHASDHSNSQDSTNGEQAMSGGSPNFTK